MIPTTAAKYQLNEEKQKQELHKYKVLNQEESLLQIYAYYGKNDKQRVYQPKFTEATEAVSQSLYSQGISISGINASQIVQPKQVAPKLPDRQRLSSAKAILQHERPDVSRSGGKQYMTPRRQERLAQPLSKIGVDYKYLYHKAVGQLGLVDVEFKSKADDLVREVLGGRMHSAKPYKGPDMAVSGNQAEDEELGSTKPEVYLYDVQDAPYQIYQEVYDASVSNCGHETARANETEGSPQNCAENMERYKVESLIDEVQQRVQTASSEIYAAQAAPLISQVQTGLIMENLLRYLKEYQKPRDYRHLELIQQVLNEGCEENEENVTVEEIVYEMSRK